MNVLAIDIGGTNIKILASGQTEPRKFPSGAEMTAKQMVSGVKRLAGDWQYDVVSIGYPGIVKEGRLATEPNNLAQGWIGFDFQRAFGRPVRLMNDAAMQALGSYQGGVMLFLGLGTGLGSALVVNHTVVPMELGRLSYKDGTFEDYLGRRGLKKLGRKAWERLVAATAMRLSAAIHLDDLVVGGGNAKKLTYLPTGCRVGSNANAFVGGFRMWTDAEQQGQAAAPAVSATTRREVRET
jgi:polyphosphate glucokinase